MKRTVAALLALTLFASAPTWAQAPAADAPDPQVLALLKEVQAQQAQLAANQAAIETKMAAIAEDVRIARIFSSRAGQGNAK